MEPFAELGSCESKMLLMQYRYTVTLQLLSNGAGYVTVTVTVIKRRLPTVPVPVR
jgi:hypothetical protein